VILRLRVIQVDGNCCNIVGTAQRQRLTDDSFGTVILVKYCVEQVMRGDSRATTIVQPYSYLRSMPQKERDHGYEPHNIPDTIRGQNYEAIILLNFVHLDFGLCM